MKKIIIISITIMFTILIATLLYFTFFNKSDDWSSTNNNIINNNVDDEITTLAKSKVLDSINKSKELINTLPNNGSKETYEYNTNDRKYYNSLSEKNKLLYTEILDKILIFEDFTYFTNNDGSYAEDLSEVFWAIKNDNHLIALYLNEKYSYGDVYLEKIESNYTLLSTGEEASIEEITAEIDVFKKATQLVVSNIEDDWSTENKYLYLATFISHQVSYEYGAHDKVSIYGGYNSIMGGTSQCTGYSVGFNFLAKEAGLYSELVDGSDGSIAHQWNLIQLNTGTYHIDITWADASDTILDDNWMKYMVLTQDEILIDHHIYNDVVATGK